MQSTLHQLFCLDGLLLDRLEPQSDAVHLFVRSPRTHALCSKCQRSSSKIHRTVQRSIKHMVHDDKIVFLDLTVRNFKCAACGSVFRESVPGVDRRRTSLHFRQSMMPKIKDRSFSAVARDHQVSASSLIRSATDLMSELATPWPTTPFALGIDAHSFSGRDLVITITDLTHHRLLTILTDDRQSTLSLFLLNIPQTTQKLMTGVCIDMHHGYRSSIKRCLPAIPIVVDKFHLIQYFNWHLAQLRQLYTTSKFSLPKQLLEKNKEDLTLDESQILAKIFKLYPTIQDMWKLKEAFRNLYRLKNIRAARHRYRAMRDALLKEARPRWKSIGATLNRWQPYVLNYFDHRITNAYTEGVHTRIKLLKRISYGFRNKQHYIAKMTLAFLPLATLLYHLNTSPSLT